MRQRRKDRRGYSGREIKVGVYSKRKRKTERVIKGAKVGGGARGHSQ